MTPILHSARRTPHSAFRLFAFWVVLMPCAFWNPCAKAQTQEAEGQVESKEVMGEVASVSSSSISVEYSRTKQGSYEMLLPVGTETRFERLKSLAEVKAGDTVRVRYAQTYKDGEDGKRIVLKTLATHISLVRPAPKDGALVSREQP